MAGLLLGIHGSCSFACSFNGVLCRKSSLAYEGKNCLLIALISFMITANKSSNVLLYLDVTDVVYLICANILYDFVYFIVLFCSLSYFREEEVPKLKQSLQSF